MRTFHLPRIDIIVKGVDMSKLVEIGDLTVLGHTELLLQLPTNSLIVCADGTVINNGIGHLTASVLCPHAISPPPTVKILKHPRPNNPIFVAVSPHHPREQRVMGVLQADFMAQGPVVHAYVLESSLAERPHYCGWFPRIGEAVQFIKHQCEPVTSWHSVVGQH